jgi:hypothetical protein
VLFSRSVLAPRIEDASKLEEAVAMLVSASRGLFVFLAAVADRLPGRLASLEVLKQLPEGLENLYMRFFELQSAAAASSAPGGAAGAPAAAAVAATTASLLHALAAAQEPPTVAELCWLAGGGTEAATTELLRTLSPFYVLQPLGGKLRAVATHKSVAGTFRSADTARRRRRLTLLATAHRRLHSIPNSTRL